MSAPRHFFPSHTQPQKQPGPQKRIPRFGRALSAVLAALLLVSCSLPFFPGEPTTTMPEDLSPAGLSGAETRVWSDLRTPLRAKLGAEADSLFPRADSVRFQLLQKIRAASLSLDSAKSRGLSAEQPLQSLSGLLLEMPSLSASRADGKVEHKDSVSVDGGKGSAAFTLTKTGAALTADVYLAVTVHGANGAALDESATGKLEFQTCPDAAGKVPVKMTLYLTTFLVSGSAYVRQQYDFKGTGEILVKNNAAAGYNLDYTSGRGGQSPDGGFAGTYAQTHNTLSIREGGAPGGVTIASSTAKETHSAYADSAYSQGVADAGTALASGFVINLAKNTAPLWQAGYCAKQ